MSEVAARTLPDFGAISSQHIRLRPDDEEHRILSPADPMASARRFLQEEHTGAGDHPLLVSWRGAFRRWTGTHYPEAEDAHLRAAVYAFLETSHRRVKDRETKEWTVIPFQPTAAVVNNVIDALRAVTHMDGTTTPPCWLDQRGAPDPGALIACRNGILELSTRRLHPHSPALFCTYALPFDFDPAAPEPQEFMSFLDSLWPDDEESVRALQEMFGYLVSGETRHQKMFLIVGPKRAGKGTIARILRALVGPENYAGPTLSGLATNFGLQSLIDRRVAIVSDARVSGRTDQAVIAERLLSITGEDVLTVDRKHQTSWVGQLPTRFVLMTNELPRLSDTSGALAGRFITLTLTRSFYGKEDTHLSDRLATELPGIFRWALDGLDRLRRQGRFTIPQASLNAMQELEDLASPMGAFVRECCVVEAGAEVDTDTLYQRWRSWCEERGRTNPTTEQVFGRDLRAVLPGTGTASRRDGGIRFRAYLGIRLRRITDPEVES